MTFTPVEKSPGDLARALEWNDAMDEIVRLGDVVTDLETEKVARSGSDSMTGPLEITGSLTLGGPLRYKNAPTPMAFIYESGTSNAERFLLAHSPAYATWGLLYRDVGDKMIFCNAGSVVMTVGLGESQVGIKTDNPNYELDVRGTIGNNTTLYHSDARWKKNVIPLQGALSRLMQLRGVQFEWRRDEYPDRNFPEGQQIGLLAQEVEAVVPEVVSNGKDGYKSLAYGNLVALLVEAVKELQGEVEKLKAALETARAAPAGG